MSELKELINECHPENERLAWVIVEAIKKLGIGGVEDGQNTVIAITGKEDGEVRPLLPPETVEEYLGDDEEEVKTALCVAMYIAANYVGHLDDLGIIKWQE